MNLITPAFAIAMHEFRATTQNFSPAILELDAATRAGRVRHDGNPVLAWRLGNVVGRADRRGSRYPTRRWPEQKINAAIALIFAVGRAMTDGGNAAAIDRFLARAALRGPRWLTRCAAPVSLVLLTDSKLDFALVVAL